MKRNVIRLTESDLHNIIKESVNEQIKFVQVSIDCQQVYYYSNKKGDS